MFSNWTSRGERVHESHDQKYTAHLCYQNLPYILLRHVFLSLSGPIAALWGKVNKGHMRSLGKKTLGKDNCPSGRKKNSMAGRFKPPDWFSLVHRDCCWVTSLLMENIVYWCCVCAHFSTVTWRCADCEWTNGRTHVTSLPEMTFCHISCFLCNNDTWPAWPTQPTDTVLIQASHDCCKMNFDGRRASFAPLHEWK